MSEIQCLAAPKQGVAAQQQLILVHGLGGDPIQTWTAKGEPDQFWPDWLAQANPELGLWTVGYDAGMLQWLSGGTAGMDLFERSENLLEQWLSESDLQHGKLYFVCHSLGGLLVKQAIRCAVERGCQAFLERLGGVVFLATPHLGSLLASFLNSCPVKLALGLALQQPTPIVHALTCRAPYLKNLHTWYGLWAQRQQVPHLNFVATQALPFWGRVVEKYSAAPLLNVPEIPIDADHSQLCKLSSSKSMVYKQLSLFLAAEQDLDSKAA